MKKWLLCFVLFVSGCRNGYTLSRNHITDHVKILFVSDESEESLVQEFYYENVDIQKVVCDAACLGKIQEAKENYIDGIVINGEKSKTVWESIQNVNQIPSIEIQKESELSALERIYPQYKWITTKDKQSKKNAYYYLENELANEEKIFFQKNNLKSICQLSENRIQLNEDLSIAIKELLEGKTYSIVYIELEKQ